VIALKETTSDPTARLALLADEPLLRPEDAARLLSVKPSWIYEAVRARRMPCLRVGRHIRFTRAMLEGWLVENGDA
jgi:excisionase family DNA binding protein